MLRVSIMVLLFLMSYVSFAQGNNAIDNKLKAALAADIRTSAEIARDRNRKPLETLNFFQLKDNMKVLELVPGGGWYTKLLAPVLKENGEYYVSVWTDRLKSGLLSNEGFEHVKTIDGINPSRSGVGRLNTIKPFSLVYPTRSELFKEKSQFLYCVQAVTVMLSVIWKITIIIMERR